MKTNEPRNTPEQEKKFTKVAPNTSGDGKKPIEEPVRKATEERQDRPKS